MAPRRNTKDSHANNKVPPVQTETSSASSENNDTVTKNVMKHLMNYREQTKNGTVNDEEKTTKRSSGNVAKAKDWDAKDKHHVELLKRLQGHFGQGPMKKFVDSKGKRSIFFEYEEKLLSEVLATYPHDKDCKPYRPLHYPMAIAIVFMKLREENMTGFNNDEIKLGFTDKQIRDKLDHMWKEKKVRENRNQQPKSTARLERELAAEMSDENEENNIPVASPNAALEDNINVQEELFEDEPMEMEEGEDSIDINVAMSMAVDNDEPMEVEERKVKMSNNEAKETGNENMKPKQARARRHAIKNKRNAIRKVECDTNSEKGSSSRCPVRDRRYLSEMNTSKDQENMERDLESGQRAPVKPNRRGLKRLLKTADDIETNEVKTHDFTANAGAAPVSSRAAMEKEAPKKKASKKAKENLEEESRKQLEQQQKMKMDQKKEEMEQKQKKMEERKLVEEERRKDQKRQKCVKKQIQEQVGEKQNRQDEIEQDELEEVNEQENRDQQQVPRQDHMDEKLQELEQIDQEQKDEEQEEDEQVEQELQRQGNVEKHVEIVQEQQVDDERVEKLKIAVKKDELIIQAISEEKQLEALLKAKKFIDSNHVEISEKSASDKINNTKWGAASSALQKISKKLNEATFFTLPLPAYNYAIGIFQEGMLRCEHQKEEEQTLYNICQEFFEIMTSAFCCQRFLKATSVKVQCEGHTKTCWIKDGHQCYKSGKHYYCLNWLAEGNNQTTKMKKAIYRHFEPEKYEQCTFCNNVWHPKCRLTRLLKDENSLPCRNTNDMLHIQHFSKKFGTTPLEKALSKNYNTNRGRLPKLQFIHSICTTPRHDSELRKVHANPKDYEYTANQIFVTVMIQNVETIIFALNTQEYRSGSKKGWVVIEYLDSLSILEENRSIIYKRIIWSYLKYARESGFKIAHLWSCAPDDGTDYLFSGHPDSQNFIPKEKLDEWYLRLFRGGEKEFGTMDVGYADKYFEEVFGKTSEEEMCSSLVLVNGFWNAEIKRIREKMRENKHLGFKFFKDEIKKVKDASKSSLFYVKLTNDGDKDKEIKKPEQFPSNAITVNRDTFLDAQTDNNIEFTDLRQAQFATRQILMEVYLARHGTSGPRNAPKPYSVFSKGSIQPQWIRH